MFFIEGLEIPIIQVHSLQFGVHDLASDPGSAQMVSLNPLSTLASGPYSASLANGEPQTGFTCKIHRDINESFKWHKNGYLVSEFGICLVSEFGRNLSEIKAWVLSSAAEPKSCNTWKCDAGCYAGC